jgi:hypothetical protein
VTVTVAEEEEEARHADMIFWCEALELGKCRDDEVAHWTSVERSEHKQNSTCHVKSQL